MFWDNVSGLYDLFETIYNGKVYRGLGRKVAEEIAPDDVVLEEIHPVPEAGCNGLFRGDAEADGKKLPRLRQRENSACRYDTSEMPR